VLNDLQATGEKIERLLDELAAEADPRVYDKAVEVIRLTTELYGAGLARVMELAKDESPVLVDLLAGDALIASLLAVHDLHPEDLTSRVEEALDRVRPFLGQHAGDVEFVAVDGDAGAVLLRLRGSCDGCPSSAVTLKLAIERAILDAAPEITRIDVDEPEPTSEPVPIMLRPRQLHDECPSGVVTG